MKRTCYIKFKLKLLILSFSSAMVDRLFALVDVIKDKFRNCLGILGMSEIFWLIQPCTTAEQSINLFRKKWFIAFLKCYILVLKYVFSKNYKPFRDLILKIILGTIQTFLLNSTERAV